MENIKAKLSIKISLSSDQSFLQSEMASETKIGSCPNLFPKLH